MALRVGLTGGLGSGKSTVAAMLRREGAHILSADEIARGLMAPGQAVSLAIADHFGPGVMTDDGRLDRGELARLAFQQGRVEELNAIVHPSTIAKQAEIMEAIFAGDPKAIVVVESALLFETQYGDGWRGRFDKLVLVAASEPDKISRFITRSAKSGRTHGELEAEAYRRLARMLPDNVKTAQCDFVIENKGSLPELQVQVDALWAALSAQS